jgi:hypothetical protein
MQKGKEEISFSKCVLVDQDGKPFDLRGQAFVVTAIVKEVGIDFDMSPLVDVLKKFTKQ